MPSTPGTSFCQCAGRLALAAILLRLRWCRPRRQSYSDSDEPTVDDIYNIVFRAFCGVYPSAPRLTFQLSEPGFHRLLDKIDQDKPLQRFFDKIRYNWNSATGTLVLLFMAAPIHERVKLDFGHALERHLDELATTIPSLRPFREKIRQRGHVFVRKLSEQGKPTFVRSPDGQAWYEEALISPFIFDVAWSHDDLHTAVDEYFQEFPADISAYLGFKIHYKDKQKRNTPNYHPIGSLYVWNKELVEDCWEVTPVIDGQVFSDEDGNAVPGRLDIPFQWLVPWDQRATLPRAARNATLSFDFEELASFVSRGGEEQRQYDNALPSNVQPKRKRLLKFLRPDKQVRKVVTFDTDSEAEPEKKRKTTRRDIDIDADCVGMRTRSRSRLVDDNEDLRFKHDQEIEEVKD
ncbi:hypothetical protein EKO27_g6591 [Xylaria grammica]|uniref:Uncharacterized protein n=1 Tax=Xylaria grammica TaxID=363999 RepID=A0A439D260_9PEZI|nr:hypothetical protein EKO27_g6591 [Xylaria grammica]